METANLRVEGMGCNRCVQTIKASLGAVNGIGDVEVDLKGKKWPWNTTPRPWTP